LKIQEFSTIPVTSCSCEKAFSKMAIIKSKIHNTMAQTTVRCFLTIFIEQEITKSINIEKNI